MTTPQQPAVQPIAPTQPVASPPVVGATPAPQQTAYPPPAQQPPMYPPPQEQNNWLWGGLIVLVFLVFLGIIMAVRAKQKRLSDTEAEILNNLETGRGGINNTSISNAVGTAKPDQNYPFAFEDAQKICSAGGWLGSTSQSLWTFLGGTNTATIKSVLTGKTKGQISAIQEAFGKTGCNQTLDAFLQTYCSEAERRQIYQIIKSAQ